MNFFSSADGQREGDGERSSLLQSASAFNTPGKSQWAGSQENTLDDDIKQYTRIQILTSDKNQPPERIPVTSSETSSLGPSLPSSSYVLKCPLCPATFSSQYQLRRHMRNLVEFPCTVPDRDTIIHLSRI